MMSVVKSSDVNMNSTISGIIEAAGKSDQAATLKPLLASINHCVEARWQVRWKLSLCNLSRWCCHGTNFIGFSHFWISQMKRNYKQNYLALQYDTLNSELRLGFEHAQSDELSISMLDLLQVVLPEYPKDLFDTKSDRFLQILHLMRLSESELHSDLFQSLMKEQSQHLNDSQILVLKNVRSFCLVMFWASVLGLYHKLINGNYLSFETTDYDWPSDSDPTIESHRSDCNVMEAFQCLDTEYSDVLENMLVAGRTEILMCVDKKTGETLMHRVVRLGKLAMMKYLLHKIKCSSVDRIQSSAFINKPDVHGNTALHLACSQGNLEIAMELLTMATPQVNINSSNPQDNKSTPLHVAAMNGHAAVVKALLSHGADAKAELSDGRTALSLVEAAPGINTEPVLGTLRRRLKQLF